MNARLHQQTRVDLPTAKIALEEYHAHVANGGRVEITCTDSPDSCVLISRNELDSLERAIEILAESPAYQRAHDELHAVVSGLSIIEESRA